MNFSELATGTRQQSPVLLVQRDGILTRDSDDQPQTTLVDEGKDALPLHKPGARLYWIARWQASSVKRITSHGKYNDVGIFCALTKWELLRRFAAEFAANKRESGLSHCLGKKRRHSKPLPNNCGCTGARESARWSVHSAPCAGPLNVTRRSPVTLQLSRPCEA